MTLLASHRELLEQIKTFVVIFPKMVRLESLIQRAEAAQKAASDIEAQNSVALRCRDLVTTGTDNQLFDAALLEAACEIERLQALVPRWRKLEEETPTDGQFCAVTFDQGNDVLPAVWAARGKAFGILGGLGRLRGVPEGAILQVARWQPLPAPPQPEER